MRTDSLLINKGDSCTETKHLIIVVDDDDGMNYLIQKTLKRYGYETLGASTGEEALAKAESNPGALMLLDYMLPDMTGKDVIERLTETGHIVAFIIITGRGDENLAVEMMKHGAMDYITKGSGLSTKILHVVERAVVNAKDREKEKGMEPAVKDKAVAAHLSRTGLIRHSKLKKALQRSTRVKFFTSCLSQECRKREKPW